MNCFLIPFSLLRGIVSLLPLLALGSADVQTGGRVAIINKDMQTIVFLENGREANLALVSTGTESHSTPTGDFRVLYKRWNPVSSTYRVRMPYWQCIEDTGTIGLHQADNSVEHRLGEPLSHGCVRLGFFTARWAYYWLPVGARVVIR